MKFVSNGVLEISVNDFIAMPDFAAPGGRACDNKALLTCNSGASKKII